MQGGDNYEFKCSQSSVEELSAREERKGGEEMVGESSDREEECEEVRREKDWKGEGRGGVVVVSREGVEGVRRSHAQEQSVPERKEMRTLNFSPELLPLPPSSSFSAPC